MRHREMPSDERIGQKARAWPLRLRHMDATDSTPPAGGVDGEMSEPGETFEISEIARHAGTAADEIIDDITGAPAPGAISRFDYQGAIMVVEEHHASGSGSGSGLGSGSGPGRRRTLLEPRPTFVLVHGIGMGRRAFGDVTRLLTAHGRVISLDQPGYGEAPEPPRTPTIERVADGIAALIRARGLGRPVLIGHSMGTQVVAEIAARHPELAGPIVLVAPTVDIAARSAPRQLGRLARDLLSENPKVLLLGAREFLRAGPHLRRKMHAMLAHRPEQAYPRIRSRALIIRGADDPVSPEGWCRSVVAMVPNAVYAEIADHGHETMIRDAGPTTDRILEFLAESAEKI